MYRKPRCLQDLKKKMSQLKPTTEERNRTSTEKKKYLTKNKKRH